MQSELKEKMKVIILPTNEESSLQRGKSGRLWLYTAPIKDLIDHTPQHLYIISNKEIKKGDWYIEDGQVKQMK